MVKNKVRRVVVVAASMLLLGGSVFAVDGITNTTITNGVGQQFSYNATGGINATGGFVNNINVSTTAASVKWQGLYGTVSGDLKLGAGSGTLFDFGAVDFSTLYVTQGTDIDWSNLFIADLSASDIAFGFSTASDPDQISDVFSSTATVAGIPSTPSVTIDTFTSGILNDGTDAITDLVFATEIKSTPETGFDGNLYDYQMMVPVKALAVNTYYFYVTLE